MGPRAVLDTVTMVSSTVGIAINYGAGRLTGWSSSPGMGKVILISM
jgi:hypothetical protein